MNTVALMTVSNEAPASFNTAWKFLKTWCVCSFNPPSPSHPQQLTGFVLSCKNRLFTIIPCEYGPIAAGAWSFEQFHEMIPPVPSFVK